MENKKVKEHIRSFEETIDINGLPQIDYLVKFND